MNQYDAFIFDSYSFDKISGEALFRYSFDNERIFEERVVFSQDKTYDANLLDKALFLAFILAGLSYYKAFPTKRVELKNGSFTKRQATFFSEVYRDGLSQYVFENRITPDVIASFEGEGDDEPINTTSRGMLMLQSGGKDSLLLAELIKSQHIDFTPLYISANGSHPAVLDELGALPLRTIRRHIDINGLEKAKADGAKNGHVPVTFIVLVYALVDAILHGENQILAAIGREGEEPHAYIGEYAVMHQWAKTWHAEQLFASYVQNVISPDLQVGSPLRSFSELRIAELFTKHCWSKYSLKFSSCNVANYGQGTDNTQLHWCGHCPKCANSFLLFAPFVEPADLQETIGGNLFKKPELTETFKGLLGIDNIVKPFECVGETEELRLAYHMAQERYPGTEYELSFAVPASNYDYLRQSESQAWAKSLLPDSL